MVLMNLNGAENEKEGSLGPPLSAGRGQCSTAGALFLHAAATHTLIPIYTSQKYADARAGIFFPSDG